MSSDNGNRPINIGPTDESKLTLGNGADGDVPRREVLIALLLGAFTRRSWAADSGNRNELRKEGERVLKAAMRGDVNAQLRIADVLETGKYGITPDPTLAYAWYKLASVQGSQSAKNSLQRLGRSMPRADVNRGNSLSGDAYKQFTAQSSVQTRGTTTGTMTTKEQTVLATAPDLTRETTQLAIDAYEIPDQPCYITTAVTSSLGRHDDEALELTVLRWYRDNVLTMTAGGRRDAGVYYEFAPTIVNAIEAGGNTEQIYRNLLDEFISPSVLAILAGQYETAYELYKSGVVAALEHAQLADLSHAHT